MNSFAQRDVWPASCTDCWLIGPKGSQGRWLGNPTRLHLSHGPIDLIIQADGPQASVEKAYQNAIDVFDTILCDLMSEIDELRVCATLASKQPRGAVAMRMMGAVQKVDGFITPMAAVAGAVADHVSAAIARAPGLRQATVNNGGDIALYLIGDSRYRVGIDDYRSADQHAAIVELSAVSDVRGVATSGWNGRSFSLGIADAVTVLAKSAAQADAFATVIANAVTLEDCAQIKRRPANELSPDSDLGTREVTVSVGDLSNAQVSQALNSGAALAKRFLDAGQVAGVFLSLKGKSIVVGSDYIKPKYLAVPNNQLHPENCRIGDI